MSEVPHHDPIPLLWMGAHDDLPDGEYQVGWAFYLRRNNGLLSKHNLQVVAAQRPPICVICPGAVRADGTLRGTTFIIDDHPTDQPDGGWEVHVDLSSLVIGQRPLITVSPSIHLVGIWHGWLAGGVLTN